MDTATQSKQKFILCVARHKGTRAHDTREQPMDAGPKASNRLQNFDVEKELKFVRKFRHSTFILRRMKL